MGGVHLVLTILIAAVALALSAGVGSPLTAWILGLASRSEPPVRTEDGAAVAPEDVLRGGTWIGVLERLAVTGSILVGYPAAIAVVIAIKGLGRFPEISSAHGAAERFIIGTLTSCLWGAVVGLGALAALTALT